MFGKSQEKKNQELKNLISGDEGKIGLLAELLEKGADPKVAPVLSYIIRRTSDETELQRLVKLALEKGADIEAKWCEGTPLYQASYRGLCDVINLLIDAGADLGAKDDAKKSPIAGALDGSRWKTVDLLIARGAEADASQNSFFYLRQCIIKDSPMPLFRFFLDRVRASGKLKDLNNEGETLLHPAAENGRTEMVEALLACPENINIHVADKRGRTALLCAINQKHARVVGILIDKGADVAQGDGKGNSPLFSAISTDRPDLVKKILRIAAERKQVLDLNTALVFSARIGKGHFLGVLIAAGAEIDCKDSEGKTPLMQAAYNGSVECVDILLKAGARTDVIDSQGNTALSLAKSRSKEKAQKMLEDAEKSSPAALVVPEAQRFSRVSDASLQVREGNGLTATFNFLTGQIIHRDENSGAIVVQSFGDIPRREAIEEMRKKLIELDGHPPETGPGKVKRAAGLEV